MKNHIETAEPAERRAYIITGPTSGFGRAAAMEIAKHGTVVLVGRDLAKLDALREEIRRKGGDAVRVLCDLSDLESVQRAAAEIAGLGLPLAGLVNNAGIMQTRATKSAQGWDMSYATNHLGAFVLTEALIPDLPDGANVVLIASATEDPERKSAKIAGFRGGRYLSAEASARGEWKPGGSKHPGLDAYATSKQCALAAAMELARETPRLRFNAVEPGFNPGTGLGRDAHPVLRFLVRSLLAPLAPHMRYGSTPQRTAPVIARVLLNRGGTTGGYYDEKGQPMESSALVRDARFTACVVAETRNFLAAHG